MKQAKALAANHQWVYRALAATNRPLTAYQVLDAVRRHGISAPPTVYRALSRLVEEGLAHRLESINAYVACADPKHRHAAAAFTICNACGGIEELRDAALLKRLHARATRRGFKINGAVIELRGHCADCQPG